MAARAPTSLVFARGEERIEDALWLTRSGVGDGESDIPCRAPIVNQQCSVGSLRACDDLEPAPCSSACNALTHRFISTCSICVGSPSTGGSVS